MSAECPSTKRGTRSRLGCVYAHLFAQYDGVHRRGRRFLQGSGQFTSHVEWGPCDPSLVSDPSLSCAFYNVPLDYNNNTVGTGRLALVKANATGDRLGTMFFNPGGPGVSGVASLSSASPLLLGYTGGQYDIVSWDPRGVGSLTIPGDVYCFDDAADYETFWNGTIELTGIEMTGNFTDQADMDRLLGQAPVMQSKYDALGQRCLNHSEGRTLQYVGTAATARDLVALADAIEGPGTPVNYWGISYGTLLGSWFINSECLRVGHVILDGVVDPVAFSQIEASLGWEQELMDIDKVYEAFYTGCALAGPEGCAIASAGQSPSEVNDDIQALLQQAHDIAVKNASAPVTSGVIRSVLRPTMYFPSGWAAFVNSTYSGLLAQVQQESSALTASPVARRTSHARRSEYQAVSYGAQAILCGDSVDLRNSTMEDLFQDIIATSRNVSQMFSAAWPTVPYYCSTWPVRAVERYEGPFNKTLANPILVIGNTLDPATPFTGAKHVADLLGEQAALVRLNTFGHTTEAAPSACIGDIVHKYVVNGTLPDNDNTVCEADQDFELFPGVNVAKILAALPSVNSTSM
ncbi:hypothetical protein BV20DRAFT_1078332 [Pilatotrama ljubarskyi]|nr:hypothetical protein BV20DRAFT_1078332 [Pilatotrama ljubarskyi]